MTKTTKRLWASVLLLTIMVSVLFNVLSPFIPQASAATTSSTEDLKRRKMAAASKCFDASIIDEDDNIQPASLADSYADLIEDGGRAENLVVGFELDRANGVISCQTAIKSGIIAAGLANNEENAMKYFIKELTGSDYLDGQEIKVNSSAIGRAANIKKDIDARLAKIDAPNDYLRRLRVMKLVTACFVASSAKPANFDPARGDFEVPEIDGYFLQRDNIDWKKEFSWINPNDGLSVALKKPLPAIGDIDLNFNNGQSGVVGTPNFTQNDSDDSSDFYPIGDDISPPRGEGYLKDAVVDCHFVKKNAAWIFSDNVTVENNTLAFTDANGNVIDPNDLAGGGENNDVELGCNNSKNPLTWFICPIVEAATKLVDQLDRAIVAELNIDEDALFGNFDDKGSTSNAFRQVWVTFRNIGLFAMLLIALIMVISQAISIGPFDAYTVKKLLPKILAGILFMMLSWDICIFLISFTNDISLALRTIIQAPFAHLGEAEILSGSASGLAGTFLIGGVVGLGIMGMLSLGATAALAVILAFFVLTIRKIALIFLVLVAPFAVVHPKLFKRWWDTFSKGLIMFPIIMGMIAVGRVFAVVASTADDGLLSQAVMLIAYFGPYFALPFAFRLAGGAIANVAGIANDRSRGLFDRLKKGRQERMADRFQRARNNKLWNPENPALKALSNYSRDGSKNKWLRRGAKALNPNELAGWAVAPHKSAQYTARNGILGHDIPFLSRAGRGISHGIEHEATEQTLEATKEMNNSFYDNDKGYRAAGGLIEGLSESVQEEFVQRGLATRDADGRIVGRALESEKDYLTAAEILEKSDSSTEKLAAQGMRRMSMWAATRYTDPKKNYVNIAAASAIGLGMHGFTMDSDIETIADNIQKEGGSLEFADAMLVQTELALASSRPDMKAGYGHTIITDAHGKKKIVSGKLSGGEHGRKLDVMDTIGPGAPATSKDGYFEDMGATYKFVIENSVPTGSERDTLVRDAENEIKNVAREKLEVLVNQRRDAARTTVRQQVPGLSAQQVEQRVDVQINAEMGQIQAQATTAAQTDERVVNATERLQILNSPNAGQQATQRLDAIKQSIIPQLEQRLRQGFPTLPPEEITKRAGRLANEQLASDPNFSDLREQAKAFKIGESVKSQHLFSVASRYSQANAGNKRRVMEIINSNPVLKREFELFEGRAMNGDQEAMAQINAINAATAQQQRPPQPGQGGPPGGATPPQGNVPRPSP